MALWRFSHPNKHGNLRTRIVHSNGSLNVSPKFGSPIIVQKFKYQYKGLLRPGIITLASGTFLVPDWRKVDPNTTLEDIEWIKPKKKVVEKTKVIKHEFKSSSSNKVYTTKEYHKTGGNISYSCNCFGSVRAKDGKCLHIKSLMK